MLFTDTSPEGTLDATIGFKELNVAKRALKQNKIKIYLMGYTYRNDIVALLSEKYKKIIHRLHI